MLLHVIFIFVSTDIDRDEDWLSRWDMLYTGIDSDRQTLTSVCVCGCHRNGCGARILSAGGCSWPRSLHRCLLCFGDRNSRCYWEHLGHLCFFLVSVGVMVNNVLVCHLNSEALAITRSFVLCFVSCLNINLFWLADQPQGTSCSLSGQWVWVGCAGLRAVTLKLWHHNHIEVLTALLMAEFMNMGKPKGLMSKNI